MSSDKLQQAIELIHEKHVDDAQKLLESLLEADPHHLPAWRWYIETIPQREKRIKALELCLKYNPDNAQIEELLNNLRSHNNHQTFRIKTDDEEKNRKHAESILKRLSILSALLITSLWIIFPLVTSPKTFYGIAFYLVIFIVTGQWILVIPATAVVFFIYTWFLHPNQQYKLSIGKRIRIPFVYNLFGASSLFVFLFAQFLVAVFLTLIFHLSK